jgi:transcriptional regulator with XRE-family HTH domain
MLPVYLLHFGMAKPQSKTTVSVLRSIIGIPARELAELTGRSIHTIKSVESGRLALSEELALKMSIETGISAEWLLNGDPQAQPIPNDLNPIPPGHPSGLFTKGYFEKRRADRAEGRDELNTLDGAHDWDAANLFAIRTAAVKSHNARLVRYRISKFLAELEKEFGRDEKTFGREIERSQLLPELGALFMHPDGGCDDIAGGEPKVVTHGEPQWANCKEFVPAFKSTYAKLAKVSKRRHEKRNPQEPGIFPLLQWASEALRVIAPKRAAQAFEQRSASQG